MRVSDVLNGKPSRLITISRDAPLAQAAQLLTREKIGMLLAVNGNQDLVGVLSEREIIAHLARNGHEAYGDRVASAMTEAWPVVSPNDLVRTAMHIMTEQRARHLPVLADGCLVGVISIGDILKSRIAEQATESAVLRDIARMSLAAAA
jgi:CBS domain-containing protein